MAMMSDMITINVHAFAAAADAMGARQDTCSVASNATVQDVWRMLLQNAPDLSSLEDTIAFARNDILVNRTMALQDGDTLSLLPPVSGG